MPGDLRGPRNAGFSDSPGRAVWLPSQAYPQELNDPLGIPYQCLLALLGEPFA